MIDRTHDLPVTRQCQILELARSTAYYEPVPTSSEDLVLMRRIDELHLEHPFAGSRMLRDLLRQKGHRVGRKHVRTLMKKMDIEALYRKPNTSKRHAAHLVSRVDDSPTQPRLGHGHHLHPDAAGFHLSGGGVGLGHAPGLVMARVEHADH